MSRVYGVSAGVWGFSVVRSCIGYGLLTYLGVLPCGGVACHAPLACLSYVYMISARTMHTAILSRQPCWIFEILAQKIEELFSFINAHNILLMHAVNIVLFKCLAKN